MSMGISPFPALIRALPSFPASHNTTLLSYITPTTLSPPVYYAPRPSLLSFISDKHLSLAGPFVVYWVLSIMWHVIDTAGVPYFEKRRIHESPEMLARNRATVRQVVEAVVWQQVVQTIFGLVFLDDEHFHSPAEHIAAMAGYAPRVADAVLLVAGPRAGIELLKNHGQAIVAWAYWWGVPIAQLLAGFVFIDTWQYMLHRGMHMSPFLYRYLHSVHHRLYVPYAFGALYNHPVEGLLLDTIGAGLAAEVCGMSIRTATALFCISTAKTIDDHCGYRIWWDPCQLLFANNADYHDIHHQAFGIKANFSQPFFITWDRLLGTQMTREQANARTRRHLPAKDADAPARDLASKIE
ncbi:Sphingolipid C4-hydroxylase sur2 [Cryptotrichosporon argae]